MKYAIKLLIFILFVIPSLKLNAQDLPNSLAMGDLSINWGIEDLDYSDRVIYLAQNNAENDIKFVLQVTVKDNWNDRIVSMGFGEFTAPAGQTISNIDDLKKSIPCYDAEVIAKNDWRLEVSVFDPDEMLKKYKD